MILKISVEEVCHVITASEIDDLYNMGAIDNPYIQSEENSKVDWMQKKYNEKGSKRYDELYDWYYGLIKIMGTPCSQTL